MSETAFYDVFLRVGVTKYCKLHAYMRERGPRTGAKHFDSALQIDRENPFSVNTDWGKIGTLNKSGAGKDSRRPSRPATTKYAHLWAALAVEKNKNPETPIMEHRI